jgi:YD repeat-containing protein
VSQLGYIEQIPIKTLFSMALIKTGWISLWKLIAVIKIIRLRRLILSFIMIFLVFGLSYSNIAKAKVEWVSPIHASVTEYFSTWEAATEACYAFMAPLGPSKASLYCPVGGWWIDYYNLLKNPNPPNYCIPNTTLTCYFYYNNFTLKQCPGGMKPNRDTGGCELPQKSNGPSPCVDQGNPVNASTGNKWQHEIDFSSGAFGLTFDRYYNASITTDIAHLAIGWMHPYAQKINIQAFSSWLEIFRSNGKKYIFKRTGNIYVADADINDKLAELKDVNGNRSGWQYTTGDQVVENYGVNGKLLSITDRTGLAQTLTYSDASTPTTVAPAAGLLLRVTEPFGHQLNFTYDANSRLSTLTDPAGGVYRYGYDAHNNLVSVTYPDGASKTYHYENASFPHALTGITDENGSRFATYTYDAQGRGISTEHAGGAERVSLAYNADGSTTVTDALGTVRTYQFQTILGVVKPKGQSQPGGSGCGASASALTYDANGNVASRTDFNGNRTDYAYDLTRNLETSRTEGLSASGAATPATRTITTAWHSTLRLPVQITNGNQQTTYRYNSQGEVTEKTVKDLAVNTARTWTTTYTYGAVPGVLLQKIEDGPRTDVTDVTTTDYYSADASCQGGHFGCRGQLQQVTDALGHVTRLTRYSAHGQVEELIDPNGLVTTLTYDLRQRLLSFDAGGETTTYSYDPAGQVTKVARPDGSYLAYSYDAAHRLTQTQDNLGNTLTYTLDALGNRIQEEAHDPSGQLAHSQSRVYDALSRLQNLIQPQ